MPVRTTRIDVSALVRSTPIQRGRSGGGGGSFGLGLPSGVTGFEFNLISDLVDGQETQEGIAEFKVDQADAVFSLYDDSEGRFTILVDGDTGDPVITDEGYLILMSNEFEPALSDVEYTVVIRVSWGGSYQDFTLTLPVVAGAPYDYTHSVSNDQFDAAAVPGQGVLDFYADDNRLQIDSVALVDDAGGRFSVVNGRNVVRTAVAVTSGVVYDLVVNLGFSDGHVEENVAVTMEAFSIA